MKFISGAAIPFKGSGGWTGRVTSREQLYNLTDDIQENHNLINQNKEQFRTMKKELNRILKSKQTRP